MSLGARNPDREDVRARLAAIESQLRSLPSRFNRAVTPGNFLHLAQATHGFIAGNVVRPDTSAWVKAQADTEAHAKGSCLVVAVPTPSTAVIALPGSAILLPGTPFSGSGVVYYLSDTTAGALTATAPAIAIPILVSTSTKRGILVIGAGGGGSGVAPTVDGTIWCSKSDLSGGEWDQTVDIGRNATGGAGTLTLLSPNAGGNAVEVNAALVTAAAKKLYIREINICDAGAAKKMLCLCSNSY